MSFITNVNTLAGKLSILEQAAVTYDKDALEYLRKAPADAINALAADIAKGTYLGKRKLDIDLVKNAKNPPTEVSYVSADIELASGYVVSFTFNVATSTSTPKANEYITDSISYQALRDALNAGITAHNAVATDPTEQVVDTYIDIVGETSTTAVKRYLTILDTKGGTSNVVSVQLHTDAATVASAKDAEPIYSWVDTTSSILLLVDHLPEFIDHTNIWQQVMAKDPLPSTGTGFLAKTANSLQWQTGAFFKDFGSVDITADFATNGIDPLLVQLGAFALVGTGGTPHADWNIGVNHVRPNAILLADPSGTFRVLDDSYHAQAIVGTSTSTPETDGLLGYDTNTQRLAISLATTVPDVYAWVDASPALSAGDLTAIIAPDGAIATGALNTQATTPKQVNQYVTNYAGTRGDVASLLTAVGQLQTDVANIPTSTNINAITADIAQNQGDIAGLQASTLALGGGTMLGALILARAPSSPMEPVNLQYASDTYLPKTGGIVSGHIQDNGAVFGNKDLVNKDYVDNSVSNATGSLLDKTGDTMTGQLKLDGTPATAPEDAVAKADLDQVVSAKLNKNGGTLTGDLDMGGNALTNLKPLAATYAPTDAAPAGYVDQELRKKIILVADKVAAMKASTASDDILYVWGV